jgi:hypothetical protein
MSKTVINENGIMRQEIGALVDTDGMALACLMFNATTDGSLLGSISAHTFMQDNVSKAFLHSGWFLVADSEAARRSVEYIAGQMRGVRPFLFEKQYSVLTTIHFGKREAV